VELREKKAHWAFGYQGGDINPMGPESDPIELGKIPMGDQDKGTQDFSKARG